ncbi:disulfide bond formation protein DsbA [Brachybacterium sp. EF45031]|uniref:DsbA family protein n=1 Tax=Brachybacterium sillae TaxID=2810536 RepID=UPI00217D9731|nr:DsbA family protein [Brachybacterium sillae]MCS6712511.1 disulfide bond formation protein DsbA [Brachybacterium sillae]
MTARRVDLFFDPTCPFAWMTSRWLLEAARVRDVEPRFRVMSLSVLNEGRDLDPGYRAAMDQSWGPARVAIRVEQLGGQDALSAYYTAFGEHYHVGGSHDRRAATEHAVAASGVGTEALEVYENVAGDETDRALRASHQGAIDLVGDEVGTPVISFGAGTAYFGPVISPAPKGEAAGKLLDALATLAETEGFYEIKRSRTGGIDFS